MFLRVPKFNPKISLIKEKWDKLLGKLPDPDEKVIVKIVIDDGGTIFESQLVEKSGFSKSKVSLILDRLEARKILERRRRGMSNNNRAKMNFTLALPATIIVR